MTKKIFMLFAALSCYIGMLAQDVRDVVYLKNGSIIKGMVIEQIPTESLKIKTSDGSLFVYKMEEVLKIVKEEVVKEEVPTISKNGLKRGFRVIGELGYEVESADGDDNSPVINFTAGYQLAQKVFLGAGIGLRYYMDDEKSSVPIYFNFRSDFINAKINPFVDVKLGYSPSLEGCFFSVGMGCRFKVGENHGLSLLTGFAIQDRKYKDDYYYYDDCGIFQDAMTSAFITVGFDF
ncbi:MAG: hypothetical protein J5735_04720 [Prevotella sp.]|nr:hypothetical protein [Prevotella sp.]